jgi:hypothetical protein
MMVFKNELVVIPINKIVLKCRQKYEKGQERNNQGRYKNLLSVR